MLHPNEDPVVTNSRREALGVLAAWLIAMTYTVGYCHAFGYDRPASSLTFVLGFPEWFFWGIVVPWTVCAALSWWYAFRFMQDADLGGDRDEGFTLDGDEGGAGG